jgi:hypothetical protein
MSKLASSNGSGGVKLRCDECPGRCPLHQSMLSAIDVASGQRVAAAGEMPCDASATDAPVEHAAELVQMGARDGDECAIEPCSRSRPREPNGIAVADDAKPPVLVR